ncbi:hypothetical protein HJC23_010514 [Cyclotella cryptica]|uniref:Steroid 5-alpha reductase C-terminal domain-containing protein n=1 Tax=Cyclotella cryptica TaxID=29204 RepID=A0ABD3QAM7_9STRA
MSTIMKADPTQLTPYHTTFLTSIGFAVLTFTVSTLEGNLSQVDKLWSILPSVYAWICVTDSRTRLMAILSTLWSIRLTFNFYRRGGYSWPKVWLGEEDYRWNVIRRGTLGGWWTLLTQKWIMVVFNIVFISLFQNWLLLWIASPSLVAWSVAIKATHCRNQYPYIKDGLNVLDGLASVLFLLALTVETIADNQEYSFQTQKRLHKQKSEKLDDFCRTGLFSIVRKPNYAAEQFLWLSYYLFSVAASYSLWNWSVGGSLALCLLFQGSGWLTEKISVRKYPSYVEYQHSVPLYVPNFTMSLSYCGKNANESIVSQKKHKQQ